MPEETDKLSNESRAFIESLTALWKRVNECRICPEEWDILFNTWKYNIMYADLTSLYLSAEYKCTEEERKKIENIKNSLDSALLENPPYKIINPNSPSRKIIFKKEFYLSILRGITLYEVEIRRIYHKYNMFSPNMHTMNIGEISHG